MEFSIKCNFKKNVICCTKHHQKMCKISCTMKLDAVMR
nr:MAG TPA: hypothetical protein [Caudoviricetes sp.]